MRILTVLALSLLTVACGFQLRGEAQLPAFMERTLIVSGDQSSPFLRELERLLEANGVEVETRPGESQAELVIVSERLRREPLTIAGDARVREFVLIFELTLSLSDPDGVLRIDRETLRLTRDYSFDEQEILAATREEEFLRSDLRQAMATRVLRRLEGLGET
ncbi:LPS-assembly lipoprotein LptE [Wenzhouxiangella marina]|uniref:LPS-assembly lipoprotein LptE n=1 Tax=Wenzhouxiangella marina TaxID=1579979 RepID=A0A0K0XTI2_9GAMM|nr:LPS assembly lipoprotein LptE [Wenzhouxiangella marina]AKS40965.1 hypothetical protein WM2015_583 [Wenzhouxiangella marina]MBB6087839.1 LPS-assembly lipoprotein [Wenzhouxiangella marina]